METPISAALVDVNSSRATVAGSSPSEGDGSTMKHRSYYDMFGYVDAASHFEAKRQEILSMYMSKLSPKLQPVLAKDCVTKFKQLCCGWSHLTGLRDFLFPEVLVSIISNNAVRCAKVALLGEDLRRRADPNGRHHNGFTPLHAAAETFSVNMVKLLLRHGASANIRTEGDKVIEGLLPLHIAVENASMHKFLEDHWEDGRPLENLISLLCMPEMKMYLDTVRLIAKHTDRIVDELWNYINDDGKLVQLAILLLAAQKQLHDPINGSRSKVSRNGFDIIRRRNSVAIGSLYRQTAAMVNEGKKGSALNKLKNKKDDHIAAGTLVDIIDNAGDALESYIQTCSGVPHEVILQRVSLILNSNDIVPYGKGIDTRKLEGYRYLGAVSTDKSNSQVDAEEPNEADKSSSMNAEGSDKGTMNSHCLLQDVPPKGLALRDVRNRFFPYWKSVLSSRMVVAIIPPYEPSMKDRKAMQVTESSRKGFQATNKSRGDFTLMSAPHLGSRFECRRKLCTVVLRSLKMVRRT